MSTPIKIAQVGTYLPATIRSNEEKAAKFGYDPHFLHEKLGFASIAVRAEEETTLDMCLQAFRDLQRKTDLDVRDIQLVTVVTQNPTLKIPHTSAILHNQLGMDKRCMTFDISQGCSGYCHALVIVQALMEAQQLDNALIFTCDSYRNLIDEEDRNVSMIFGDGATATLLSRTAAEGFALRGASFGTVPDSHDCLIMQDRFLRMEGGRVFQYAAQEIPKSIAEMLAKHGLTAEEVNFFLFHQGSKYIVDSLVKLMKIYPERSVFSSGTYGNTVSSSLPILLSDYQAAGGRGTIVLSGFGVGFTWGHCLLKYTETEE